MQAKFLLLGMAEGSRVILWKVIWVIQSNFLLKARITVFAFLQMLICFSFNAGIRRFHIFLKQKAGHILGQIRVNLLRYADALVGSQRKTGIYGNSLYRAKKPKKQKTNQTKKNLWVVPEFWCWFSHGRGSTMVQRLGFGGKPGLESEEKTEAGPFICMGAFQGLGGALAVYSYGHMF